VTTAFITGITGQDGYYLANHLLAAGYEVHGLVRGQRNPKRRDVERDLPDVKLHDGDITDEASIRRLLARVAPDEVYNLAAVSYVQYSFENPVLTAETTGVAVLRLLEVLRDHPTVRFYQASTSEMFGLAASSPQNESTPFHPRSPYAVSKVFAHHAVVNYREAYGLFAVSGILFNHESPRRGAEFVTRKVTQGVAAIKAGRKDMIELGNLDARRDWGFAGDYVRAMHLMLQQPSPSDFVVGTGTTHSVRDLVSVAFRVAGLDWQQHVKSTADNLRPADVPDLRADASRAKQKLGWTSETSFEDLIAAMVEADIRRSETAAG
jgi:GDPmannose 4,6-dehydratase